MDSYALNTIIAALIYSLAAIFSKAALEKGCGVLRLSFLINQIFVLVFCATLGWNMEPFAWSQIHLPVFAGLLFFIGQIFTFAAIRIGDVSLQTPVMGTKAVFVAIIAIVFGLEEVSWKIGFATIVAALAVALLGFSEGAKKRLCLTILLSLLSALSFAGSDQMVGVFGAYFGKNSFLIITIVVNALLSFGMIPFFNAPLRAIPGKSLVWAVAAALGMGLQAVILNYTLAASGEVVAVNIIYSLRGLFSVILGLLVGFIFAIQIEHMSWRSRIQRIVGALLISLAVVIALCA
ncbi:MAG: EamA family transporter [Verrucomicrobiota bacterium]